MVGHAETRSNRASSPSHVRTGGRCHDWSAMRGMTDQPTTPRSRLPHHKLHAFGVAMRLLEAVRAANIRDRHLRDEALRAAKSTALNTAEAAGRVTPADKARALIIARGEACEACAAVEIAVASGDVDPSKLPSSSSWPSPSSRWSLRSAARAHEGCARPPVARGPSDYRGSRRSIRFTRTASARSSLATPASTAAMASARSTAPTSSCKELFAMSK